MSVYETVHTTHQQLNTFGVAYAGYKEIINFLDSGKIVVQIDYWSNPNNGGTTITTHDCPYERVPNFVFKYIPIMMRPGRQRGESIGFNEIIMMIKLLKEYETHILKQQEEKKDLEIQSLQASLVKQQEELKNTLSKQQEDKDLEIQSLKNMMLKQKEEHDLEIIELKKVISKQDEELKSKNISVISVIDKLKNIISEQRKERKECDLEIQSLK